MQVRQDSFPVTIKIKTALAGRQQYLRVSDIARNYPASEPHAVDFWLECRETGTGNLITVPQDRAIASTEHEICFVLPSSMFEELKRYNCVLKLKVNGIEDCSKEYFALTVTPKKG